MAARPGVDVAGWLTDQRAAASPDVLRAMVRAFAEALMAGEAGAVCAVPGTGSTARSEPPPRLPGSGVRHPGRDGGTGDPKAGGG